MAKRVDRYFESALLKYSYISVRYDIHEVTEEKEVEEKDVISVARLSVRHETVVVNCTKAGAQQLRAIAETLNIDALPDISIDTTTGPQPLNRAQIGKIFTFVSAVGSLSSWSEYYWDFCSSICAEAGFTFASTN